MATNPVTSIEVTSELTPSGYRGLATFNGLQAGYLIGCGRTDNHMIIADLVVRDQLVGRKQFLRRSSVVAPRGRGIGSRLLAAVVEFADLNHLALFGQISHKDLNTSPFLNRWYRRSGFEIGLEHVDDFRAIGGLVTPSTKWVIRRLPSSHVAAPSVDDMETVPST